MKNKFIAPAVLGMMLTVIVALAAYPSLRGNKRAPTAMKDKGYSTKLKALRERFNADKGKVKLLLLLSPT